ncbi:hypothetical protein [Streptomyces physcomitrii]|uniref:Transcription factor zinc-finger domain-containing protein n=1 Tax=Streptomyces physcomitrii TaxID=2724184 RepID=A0ABX1H678_9ACTN|nr:hypothetical protein [Streptomyces physcomitrii]NKI43872.1 hypothetical protein [Streptomyces physcomitrii]
MMPLDPMADIGRRAWLPCPNCAHGADCGTCGAGRSCTRHWQYLLSNKGPRVFLQCPDCTHLWDTDPRGDGTRGR